MTTDQAWQEGVELVRADGLDIRPTDPAMIVAQDRFEKVARAHDHEPDFDRKGPASARWVILQCYAA